MMLAEKQERTKKAISKVQQDSLVWILLLDGPGTLDDLVVLIDDIQWFEDTGAIGAVVCDPSDGATTTALFDKDSLEFTMTPDGLDTAIAVHCNYDGFHGEIDKVLLETCLSTDLEVKRSMAQTCIFKITYDGARATIVDTISAGWKADPVVFTNDGGLCSVDDVGGKTGKNKKGNFKSATGFTCVDIGVPADFDVTIETRPSPGKGHGKKGETVFKPTSCSAPFGEPFDINSGAKAILLDDSGVPVLGTLDGKPIVLDSTDPLSVNVGENTSDGITCEEA